MISLKLRFHPVSTDCLSCKVSAWCGRMGLSLAGIEAVRGRQVSLALNHW